MTIKMTYGYVLAAVVFVAGLLALEATPAYAFDGVLACQGSNSLLSGGAEGNLTFTHYRINNFNDVGSIQIDRIRVYSGDGDLVCEFPNDAYSLPSGFTYLLEPHQHNVMTTKHMNNAGCLEPPNPPAQGGVGNITTLIYWSYLDAGDKIPLHATYTDVSQDLNAATKWNHIGRGLGECIDIKLKKDRDNKLKNVEEIAEELQEGL